MSLPPIVPVILAGGIGTRLWPLSREQYPKQFHQLVTDKSMLQETCLRLDQACKRPALVVCNQQYRFITAEQLRSLPVPTPQILLEPCGRNTAAAITLAALHLQMTQHDPLMLVAPSDHHITDTVKLSGYFHSASQLANEGQLLCFGIKPSYPATGYGYIELGSAVVEDNVYRVNSFTEKPPLELAKQYLATNNFCWNSGMFMFKASVLLAEVERYAPEVLQACQQAYQYMTPDLDFMRIGNDFAAAPSISIDYAVMEKTHNALVMPIDIDWSDVGSWRALHGINQRDANNNYLQGNIVTEDVEDSLIVSTKRMVAAIGVKDLYIIETADAVLVCGQSQAQNIPHLVNKIKQLDPHVTKEHLIVHRPWGSYEILVDKPGYKVKRICVNQQASLSLQAHRHRAEHWVIIRGEASIVCGERTLTLSRNQSIYIPPNTKHRLANQTDVQLELIEVQTGDYLGEDDIIRFADDYGRPEQIAAEQFALES